RYLQSFPTRRSSDLEQIYDLAVVLSGPEPQRTMFEEIITTELLEYKGKVVFVKGKIEIDKKSETTRNITFHNFMNSKELEQVIKDRKSTRLNYSHVK